ncbi:MAG: hypothetical protein GX424_07750 [Clostridiales bacterium]|nr:hypothetical protein [Clostridiales bacterium]
MNDFGVAFLAVIVEGVITYGKELFVSGKIHWQMLCSVLLGVLTAVAYGLDIPAAAGLKTGVPYLGCVLTGILISRGSNYVFDLIQALGAAKEKTAP